MIDSTLTSENRRQATRARPGPLGVLAGMAFRRRRRVVLGWVAALALAIGLSAAFAGDFAADYSAPGSDSKQAQDLLEQRFPVQAGDTVDVVVRSDTAATAPDPVGRRRPPSRPRRSAITWPRSGRPTRRRGYLLTVSPGRALKLDVANPVDMRVADSRSCHAPQASKRPGPHRTRSTIQAAEQGAIGRRISIAGSVILLVTSVPSSQPVCRFWSSGG
jgi:RND superfamily putative drug exporter